MAANHQNPVPGTPPGEGKRHVSFEPLALVLLSLATVGTAWCSFQSASWGAVSQKFGALSADASRRAAAAQLQASQIALLDVLLFSQHINARVSSNFLLAEFYSDRFRGEAKTAFNAWLAMKPFENSNAPPHPFVPALYQPQLLRDAGAAQAEGERYAQQSGDAGRVSRNYILVTVLLACALFCGGIGPKFELRWIRLSVMGLGLGVFVFAVFRLLALPVQLS